jgi:hypothetical protein
MSRVAIVGVGNMGGAQCILDAALFKLLAQAH